MSEQSTPPDVFSQRVAVLEGSIRHHESERQQAQQRADQAARRRDERRAELITYLKAQNTVLRQQNEQMREANLCLTDAQAEALARRQQMGSVEETPAQNTSGPQENYSPSKLTEDLSEIGRRIKDGPFTYGDDVVSVRLSVEVRELLPGEQEGFYYLIDVGHGDILKCPGDKTVASEHLIEIREAYHRQFPDGATSRAKGHEPPLPWLYGCYGPYPHTFGGEDDPTGFRSYGAVPTLEGRRDKPEIVRVRKPGGDRIEACDVSTAPPAYLHGDTVADQES